MTNTNTNLPKLGEDNSNLSNRHINKIRNEKLWNTLRSHIMYRREKQKLAERDAQLRKKLYWENQNIKEYKLALIQINSRLSELLGKGSELEKGMHRLLKQKQATEYALLKTREAAERNSISAKPPSVNEAAGTVTNGPFAQPRQTLRELIASRSDALSPSLINKYNPLSVVIPTKINGSRPNYWIIHHPK